MKIDRNAVAREAGVSTATVSRVLNSSGAVSEERKRRVLDAVTRLGYSPNKFASALARNSTGRLLFVDCNKLSTHDAENAGFYSSLYKDSLEAILREIDTSPYHLTIDLDGSADPSGYDGVILFDVDSESQAGRYLDSRLPVVFGHHVSHFARGSRFAVDNFGGSRRAAELLAETGHRKPACITGKLSEINAHRERLRGFLEVYPEHRVRIEEGELGPEGGERSLENLIPAIRSGRVDCLSVVNDLTAFGVVRALLREGIRIPEDVSVVSFDNLPFIRLLPVRLTTLDLGLGNLYRRAALTLLELLRTPLENRIDRMEIFVPELAPGASVRDRN